MKRAIALVVTVAYLMQLTGCAVYRIHRLRPTKVPEPVYEIVRGATTVSGEKLRFDKNPVLPPHWTPDLPPPPVAWVQGDTLLAYAKGELHRIALSDIRELWVKRKDPTLSIIATVAFCATIIVALKAIGKAMAEWVTPDFGGWWPPDFGGGVG